MATLNLTLLPNDGGSLCGWSEHNTTVYSLLNIYIYMYVGGWSEPSLAQNPGAKCSVSGTELNFTTIHWSIAHCKLHNTHCTLHTAKYTLDTTHYSTHTTHYSTHTTHYSTHTAHCRLYSMSPARGCWLMVALWLLAGALWSCHSRHSVHYTVYTEPCVYCTVYILYSLHCTICTL